MTRAKWHHFVPSASFDGGEPITRFLDECTRDQLRIKNLIETNKELRAALGENKAEQMLKPGFLANLVALAVANKSRSKHNFEYSDVVKEAALYIYVLVGHLAYSTLAKNFAGGLPGLSTVRRMLAQKPALDNDTFRFEYIKSQMVSRNEPLYVICAEDDTKATERLRYDWNNDSIVGFQVPLNEDGVPIQGLFKFTSLEAAQSYIDNNLLATYAKIMTVRSMSGNSTIYHLVIYGTRGSDKATEVLARREYVQREFAKIGIEVVCKYAEQNITSNF